MEESVTEEFRELYGDEPADEIEAYMRHLPSTVEEHLNRQRDY